MLNLMKSIVIIDDDTDTLEMYVELLAEGEYRIFPAAAGRLGLRLTERELPHLVILDLLIPGDLNGQGVLGELKKNKKTKHIPVLVITNYDAAREAVLSAGAAGFLTKAQSSVDTILDHIRTLTHK